MRQAEAGVSHCRHVRVLGLAKQRPSLRRTTCQTGLGSGQSVFKLRAISGRNDGTTIRIGVNSLDEDPRFDQSFSGSH